MYDNSAEVSFMRMLANLETKVRILEDYFSRLSTEQIAREVSTANALLSSLWEKLRTDRLNPATVYSSLSNLQYRLRALEMKATAAPSNFWGWLRRAYNFIADAINFVTSLIGAGPLLPKLSNPIEIKLLEYNEYNCDD